MPSVKERRARATKKINNNENNNGNNNGYNINWTSNNPFMTKKQRNKAIKEARERRELLGNARGRSKNLTRLWNLSASNVGRRRNAVAALNRKLLNKTSKMRMEEYKQALKNGNMKGQPYRGIFSPSQFGKALANKTRNNAKALRKLEARQPTAQNYYSWRKHNPANAAFLNTTGNINYRNGGPEERRRYAEAHIAAALDREYPLSI
jgi:hypothetical protein